MSDVFKRKPVDIRRPITADMCMIQWDGILSTATNLVLNYQQGVTRRRTLGTNGRNVAVLYASQPMGSISMQRLIAEGTDDIFGKKGWSVCDGLATIRLNFTGASTLDGCDLKGDIITCLGCLVTGYSLSAEAEGLTVIDNVTIEFLQMERTAQ